MGSKENDIENHILKLIKQCPPLYEEYMKFKSRIDNVPRSEIPFVFSKGGKNNKNIVGDAVEYFRLSSIRSAYNSLYYFFEMEKILTSKFGIRYTHKNQSLFPLSFPFHIFPLFSFTFDNSMYALYWKGKEEGNSDLYYFFKLLQKSGKPFISLEAGQPTKVEVSSLKFVEPNQQLMPISEEYIEKLGSSYIFNWLFPPEDPEKTEKIWWESPFIFFDDSVSSSYFEIILINKTISYSKGNTIKVLNSNLKWIDVSNLCESNFKDLKGLKASLMVRKFICNPKLGSYELKKECRILTMDKIKLTDNDDKKKHNNNQSEEQLSHGFLLGDSNEILYTLISIILRNYYLSSSHPFNINKSDVVNKVKEFLHDPIFKSFIQNQGGDQLGWRLLDPNNIDNNIDIIIKSLGVYEVNTDSIIYLHPVLYEVLYYLKNKGINTSVEKLLRFVMNLTENKVPSLDINEFNKVVRNYFNISITKNGIMDLSIILMQLPRVISFSKAMKGELYGS